MQVCETLDKIPQVLAEGGMTVDEAAMKVLEVVYTNPGRFNLLDMAEDERSDFLLETLPKFRRLLERYDKSLGPLGAYVYYSLPGWRFTWSKRFWDSASGKKGVGPSIRDIYEDTLERRPLLVAEPRGAKKRQGNGDSVSLVFKRVFGPVKYSLEPREKVHRQRSALVLALKSAWYIDDDSVKKVCGFCGCSSENMNQVLEKIKTSLVEKNERRQDMAERRDKAWYFVCKYRQRLAVLSPNSDAWKKVKRKLDYQLSSWKTKNRLLQGCRMNLTPRNEDLAKMLHLHPHRITAFLRYARKMADQGETLLSSESAEDE